MKARTNSLLNSFFTDFPSEIASLDVIENSEIYFFIFAFVWCGCSFSVH